MEHHDLPAPRTSTTGGARPLESVRTLTQAFPYDEIDAAMGASDESTPAHLDPDLARALAEVLRWLAVGENGRFDERAVGKRALVIGRALGVPELCNAPVSRLALEKFGMTAEGLNRYVRAFNRRFGVSMPGQHLNTRRARTTHTPPTDPSRN